MAKISMCRRKLIKNSIGYTAVALFPFILVENSSRKINFNDDANNEGNYYMIDGWIFSAKDFAEEKGYINEI